MSYQEYSTFFNQIQLLKFNVYLIITALLNLDWPHFKVLNSLTCLAVTVLGSTALEF